jgi:hypothetical protein
MPAWLLQVPNMGALAVPIQVLVRDLAVWI